MPVSRSTIIFAMLVMGAWSGIAAPAAATDQPPNEITLHERDLIEASLDPYLILPETALWRFTAKKPYLGSTKVVCGSVNYQSSVRKYVGYHRFYALLDDGHVTLSQIEDQRQDTSGRLREKLDLLCGNA